MRQKVLFALAAVLFSSGGVALAEEPTSPAEYAKLQPARLVLPSLKKVSATQFLSSDRKGRIFLLRGDTLEVFRLRAGASADSLGRLACSRAPEREPEGAYAAAMDPEGTTWAVADSMFEGPLLCDFQKLEKPTRFTGWISSLTFSRNGPLAAVIPLGNGGMDVTGNVPPQARVLKLEGDHWEAASWAPPSGINMRSKNYSAQVKAQSDAMICTDRKGKIWLAAWNLYRLQQVSSFVEPDREVVVGASKVKWVDWTAEEQAKIDADLRKEGIDPATNQIHSSPQSVFRAVVCASDGFIYLLVSMGEKLALDRYDPSTDALERVLLEGVEVSGGPMAAALGSDGLVIGGRLTDGNLWRISPDDLATARWKPVLGARIDGNPAP
jgi:hypothetical protein